MRKQLMGFSREESSKVISTVNEYAKNEPNFDNFIDNGIEDVSYAGDSINTSQYCSEL